MNPRCQATVAREFSALPESVRREIADRFGLDDGLDGQPFVEWTLAVVDRAKERRTWSPFDWAVRTARWTQQGRPWM